MGALAREVPGRTMHGAHHVENNGSRGGEDRSQKVLVSLDLHEPSEASWQAGLGDLWTLGWNAVSTVVGPVLIVAAAEAWLRVTTRSHGPMPGLTSFPTWV